jgi:hypothetical protein
VSSRPNAHLSIVPAVRTTYHTVWTPDRPKHHPSRRRGFPSGHSFESRSFCSSLHPSKRLSSPSGRLLVIDQASDFLSKIKYGKIAATVRMMWIPVRTRYSLRQVRNSNSTVQTSVCHGPDARSTDMEIACRRSTVRTAIPHGPDVQSLSKEVTCSGRATIRTIVPHRPDAALKQERFLTKILEFWLHSCPFGRPMSTFRTTRIFIKAVTHLNPQPINRGPWALRTARIRY